MRPTRLADGQCGHEKWRGYVPQKARGAQAARPDWAFPGGRAPPFATSASGSPLLVFVAAPAPRLVHLTARPGRVTHGPCQGSGATMRKAGPRRRVARRGARARGGRAYRSGGRCPCLARLSSAAACGSCWSPADVAQVDRSAPVRREGVRVVGRPTPAIDEKSQKKCATDRKSSWTSGSFRGPPRILREPPKPSENPRKPPKAAENLRKRPK